MKISSSADSRASDTASKYDSPSTNLQCDQETSLLACMNSNDAQCAIEIISVKRIWSDSGEIKALMSVILQDSVVQQSIMKTLAPSYTVLNELPIMVCLT